MTKQTPSSEFMSEEEYLAFERASSWRHEYVAGMVYAMVGEKIRHKYVVQNLFLFLHARLDGTGCEAFVEGIKIKAEAARSYYYPDVFVTCSKTDLDADIELKPCLVIEALSKSTASIDRREKRVAYTSMPSVKEYLIINCHRQEVEMYRRQSDRWTHTILLPSDGDVELLSLPGGPTKLAFSQIYKGFDPFPPIRVKEEEAEYQWWNE